MALAHRLLPGFAVCVVITGAASVLQRVEQALFGRVWLESLVLAIALGALLRTMWTPSARWRPGIAFGARTVLEVAVVLLGASLDVRTLIGVGPALLAGVAAVVPVAIALSYGIGRMFGLPSRLATLVACGNSICGNSAIAAVAPVIGADGAEVSAAIAFTALLGMAVVAGLPVLGVALHLTGLGYGVLAGLTVYAVPQVLAATASAGAAALQIGTLVKLVRVLMLGPVLIGLSFHGSGAGRRLALHRLLPWFILGFLGLAALRGFGLLPERVLHPAAGLAAVLTAVSMAALGLQTDLRAAIRAGGRVTAAVVLSLLALGVVSLALIRVLQLG